MPEYKFKSTATDTNPDILTKNISAESKVVCDAEKMPFTDGEFDLTIMRYVLQFNSLEGQRNILNEISRVTKEFAIVQHAGASDINPVEWRNQVQQIFSDKLVLGKIYREGMFYSSMEEVESLMKEEGIVFRRVSSRRIDKAASRALIEKFHLNDTESKLLLEMLGNQDYIIQTTWILFPKEQKTE